MNPKKLIKIAKMLDEKKLYALADKVDRFAQNKSLDFDNFQQALEYIKKLGKGTFTANMDFAADQGVTIGGIPIQNDARMKKLYKSQNNLAMPMTPMPAIAPMAPMAPISTMTPMSTMPPPM